MVISNITGGTQCSSSKAYVLYLVGFVSQKETHFVVGGGNELMNHAGVLVDAFSFHTYKSYLPSLAKSFSP